MINRLCLFCIHFHFDTGEPAYSEYTPGSDFESYCLKRYWDFNELHRKYSASVEFGMIMAVKSANCPDYILANYAKKLGAPE